MSMDPHFCLVGSDLDVDVDGVIVCIYLEIIVVCIHFSCTKFYILKHNVDKCNWKNRKI